MGQAEAVSQLVYQQGHDPRPKRVFIGREIREMEPDVALRDAGGPVKQRRSAKARSLFVGRKSDLADSVPPGSVVGDRLLRKFSTEGARRNLIPLGEGLLDGRAQETVRQPAAGAMVRR